MRPAAGPGSSRQAGTSSPAELFTRDPSQRSAGRPVRTGIHGGRGVPSRPHVVFFLLLAAGTPVDLGSLYSGIIRQGLGAGEASHAAQVRRAVTQGCLVPLRPAG